MSLLLKNLVAPMEVLKAVLHPYEGLATLVRRWLQRLLLLLLLSALRRVLLVQFLRLLRLLVLPLLLSGASLSVSAACARASREQVAAAHCVYLSRAISGPHVLRGEDAAASQRIYHARRHS